MKTKSTKKTVKPDYTVDLTDIEYLDEIEVAFALAKHNSKLPMTDEELLSIVTYVTNHAPLRIYCLNCLECKPKKQPWYKKVWNWLIGRK